jgi:opacity protein-like surface antigen
MLRATLRRPKAARVSSRGIQSLLVGIALTVMQFGTTGAWAQCTDNYPAIVPIPGGGFASAAQVFPLGGGSSVAAFVSTINTVNTAFLTTTSSFVSSPSNPQPDQQGSGVWGRAIAGAVDTKTTGVATGATGGTETCNTTTRQTYAGYQVGHDIAVLNSRGSGANWHFGVTAGYMEAKTKDITPAGSFINPNFPGIVLNTPAGSFSETSQVPFMGLYTAFSKGGFFADGQVRWDFYQNSLTDPLNGLSSQRLDARGFSVTGNVGYNIPLHSNWFIEPTAGVLWSRVEVDPLNVSGVSVAGFTISRGSVVVDDIQSVLGRASVRVGTNITSGNVTWQPFFTASVFHEFAGDVTGSTQISGTGNVLLDGNTATGKIAGGVGTYGQFALGTAVVLGNTGWLGYARGDYRIGDHIEGWSVNTGLRYQFSPEQRGSIKDGPVPTLYSYNWTGPYIGAFVGATRGEQDWRFVDPPNTTLQPDFAGYLIGGQAGYNIQRGHWVVGVEGDFGSSNARGGISCPNQFFFTCEANANRLASLTGRLGVTWGRALFYAKAGLAAGEIAAGTSRNDIPGGGNGLTTTKWSTGWTVGGGMEFALTDRWSAKAEYMHYDLGSDTYTTFVLPGSTGLTDVETRGEIVRVGVNLHFNPVQREVPLK